MFRPSVRETIANPACAAAMGPGTCLKLWLLLANCFAWLVIVLVIRELLS